MGAATTQTRAPQAKAPATTQAKAMASGRRRPLRIKEVSDDTMEIVDGTGVIVIHGTSGMPVWGKAMREEAVAQCRASGCNSEAIVRERLRALADYLAFLQEK